MYLGLSIRISAVLNQQEHTAMSHSSRTLRILRSLIFRVLEPGSSGQRRTERRRRHLRRGGRADRRRRDGRLGATPDSARRRSGELRIAGAAFRTGAESILMLALI